MRGNLKALALALAAVFAMSAIAASSALAVGEEFHSEDEKTVIEGTSHPETTQDFELENGAVFQCPALHAEGTVVGTGTPGDFEADEVTVGIDVTGGANGKCDSSAGKENTTIDDEGCHFTLDSDTTEGNPTGGEHANVTLTCDSGALKVTGSVNITVKNQTIEHAVRYDNTGSGSTRDITVTATAHGIEWECSNSTFVCNIGAGGKTGTDASYTGSVTTKGFEDPEVQGETGPYDKVNQIGIWEQ